MVEISLDQLPYDPSRLFENPLVELTQSSVQTFLRCPQKFVFQYLMLLRSKGISWPLLIGGAVHEGLDTLLNPSLNIPMNDRLIPALEALDRKFQKYEGRADLLLGGQQEKFEHSRAVAHACLEAWWILNAEDLASWKVIQTEMNVRVDLTKVTTASEPHERMAGKLDGLIIDPDDGAWLLEHKTRSRLDNLNLLTLELDLQVLWYIILMVTQVRKNPDKLRMPKGFLYNAIQKPQHRMSAAGWTDLKDRMCNAMVADPQKYYHLEPMPVEAESLNRAYDNIKRIIHQMDSLTPDTVYMNLTACGDFGGCPYRILCQNRATVAHPEEVLHTPGIDLFELRAVHEELSDQNPDSCLL